MLNPDLSDRDMEERLLAANQVCQASELPRVPDHTTWQRTTKKLRMLDLEKMMIIYLCNKAIQKLIRTHVRAPMPCAGARTAQYKTVPHCKSPPAFPRQQSRHRAHPLQVPGQ